MRLLSFSILTGAALISLALFLRPSANMQALYGDGYIYVIDLKKKNIANIIPGKTRMTPPDGPAREP